MRFISCFFLFFSPFYVFAQVNSKQNKNEREFININIGYYQKLHLLQHKIKNEVPIKIAVIDDGFRLSHKALKNYVYSNSKEVPGNFQDDDKNGFVDDMHGWDVSDNDNDVSVKKGKEAIFYHGTYIASIITSTLEYVFGKDVAQFVQIIPIKTVSDNTRNTYLKDGYKGFRYAKSIGADIICCAWSGGEMTEDDKAIIKDLVQQGTIIIGSAGNFFNEEILTPASIDGVICVAATDSVSKKTKESNFGMRVDVCAPGKNVYGAYPEADNSFIYEGGTSPAAALVTGCVAILKLLYPNSSLLEIEDALKNTASPIDSLNLTYSGKLGAGVPNMEKAITFLSNQSVRYLSFDSLRAKGKIYIQKSRKIQKWKVHPAGAFNGIHLQSNTINEKVAISVYNSDTISFKGKAGDLIGGLYLPGTAFDIELMPGTKNKSTELSYYMETIDSTKLYCTGVNNILVSGDGILSDNSGNNNYANNCSCQWQLTAPKGKRIRIEMLEMNTEPNVDYIWFFDGEGTLQERLLAKFSGTEKPPIIESLTNNLLVWFLTDNIKSGKGWKLKYSLVE
jgi:subtilisin family serine protease